MRTSLLLCFIGPILILGSFFVWNTLQQQAPAIVAFGDSLTYGVGSARGGGFVKILSKSIALPIENLGIPGDTTADALLRINTVLEKGPTVAIVFLGGNDLLQHVSVGETAKNLALISATLKSKGIKVLMLKLDILEDIWGHPELMSDSLHPNDKGYAIMAARIEPELRKLIR